MPRLALLRDGTAVGCFTVRHHETHVVIVEPNGHAFSHVGPHGRPSRHLTATLLSTQRALVAETMRFRNRYAWCTVRDGRDAVLPYVHTQLGDRSAHTRRRTPRSDALTVGWPRPSSYSTRAMWNIGEQLFEIMSLDGAARVQLHASGKLAHAIYLVAIHPYADASEHYAWVQQTFPVAAAPACFAFPVQLLLHARLARGSGSDSLRVVDSDAQPSAFALPGNSARLDVRPTFRPLHDEQPTGAPLTPASLSADTISRWIKGLSKSLDRWVVAERDDGVDWIVGLDDAAPTVLIVNDADASDSDRSLIECDRGFFRAFDRTGDLAQQFTTETIPLELATFNRDCERTTAILLRAAALFDASCRPILLSTTQTLSVAAAAEGPAEAAAVTVLEDLSNDLGRFRAFSDGRVRVVFADRTILQVAPLEFTDECSFTYRDGSMGKCTSDSASPAQQHYLRLAMDFAQWAFATPEQRFRRHELQLEQQRLIATELHKITIRHELNSVRVGPSRTDPIEDPMDRSDTAELSPDAVAQLQRETQLHMTHVQTLLDERD